MPCAGPHYMHGHPECGLRCGHVKHKIKMRLSALFKMRYKVPSALLGGVAVAPMRLPVRKLTGFAAVADSFAARALSQLCPRLRSCAIWVRARRHGALSGGRQKAARRLHSLAAASATLAVDDDLQRAQVRTRDTAACCAVREHQLRESTQCATRLARFAWVVGHDGCREMRK